MRSAIFFSFLVFFTSMSSLSKAQTEPVYQWAKNIGGPNYDEGKSITTDIKGNIYITGSFSGTVDFDPSPASVALTSVGADDIFLAKFDSKGNYKWAFNLGSNTSETGLGVAVDKNFNVYLTGYFMNTTDFNPSSSNADSISSSGGWDIFLAKYDSSGNYLWAKGIGGAAYDAGNALTTFGNNVFLTGYFRGTADFDPSSGTANLSSAGSSADIFIASYDSLGNYKWAKAIGSNSDEEGRSIAADNNGNIYTTGFYWNTVDFNPGGSTANQTAAGRGDVFLVKYDDSGNFQWSRSFGGTDDDFGNSVCTDLNGNVYLTGNFYGTSDFDPTGAFASLTATGSDMFISKFSSAGNFIWAKNMGDIGSSIASDVAGNLYVTGQFSGTADFDPSGATAYLTSVGNSDIVIGKYDETGKYLWAKNIGSSGFDHGNAISIDYKGRFILTGNYSGTANFDPSGMSNLSPVGSSDIFLAKYARCNDVLMNIPITICNGDEYTLPNGKKVSTPGTFLDTLKTTAGCDSVIITMLTVSNCNSINESPRINDFNVFPNPTSDNFTLNFNLREAKNISVQLFNLLGEKIQSLEYANPSKNFKAEINIQSQPEGIYFLVIKIGEKTVFRKVIKK